MTRSVLQPLRTRRATASGKTIRPETSTCDPTITPSTRKTLAAIGALWVSFAVTSSGKSGPSWTPLKRGSPAPDHRTAPLQLAGVTSVPQ